MFNATGICSVNHTWVTLETFIFFMTRKPPVVYVTWPDYSPRRTHETHTHVHRVSLGRDSNTRDGEQTHALCQSPNSQVGHPRHFDLVWVLLEMSYDTLVKKDTIKIWHGCIVSAVVYINLRFGLSTNKCVVYAEVSVYHRIMRLFESAAEILGEVLKICFFIYLF